MANELPKNLKRTVWSALLGVVVFALAINLFAPSGVASAKNQSPTPTATATPSPSGFSINPSRTITICHATSSLTNPYNTLHVNSHAISGHFWNNGTPKSGHEDDILIDNPTATCPGGTTPTPTPSLTPSSSPKVSPTPVPTVSPYGSPSPIVSASPTTSPKPSQTPTPEPCDDDDFYIHDTAFNYNYFFTFLGSIGFPGGIHFYNHDHDDCVTPSPSATPTPRVTPTPTATPTSTPVASPSATPTPEPTVTPEGSPSPLPSETPTATPTPEPTPTETPSVTPTPEPTPTATPTPSPTATPSDTPTATPTPVVEGSETPIPVDPCVDGEFVFTEDILKTLSDMLDISIDDILAGIQEEGPNAFIDILCPSPTPTSGVQGSDEPIVTPAPQGSETPIASGTESRSSLDPVGGFADTGNSHYKVLAALLLIGLALSTAGAYLTVRSPKA